MGNTVVAWADHKAFVALHNNIAAIRNWEMEVTTRSCPYTDGGVAMCSNGRVSNPNNWVTRARDCPRYAGFEDGSALCRGDRWYEKLPKSMKSSRIGAIALPMHVKGKTNRCDSKLTE